jgi:hypothetical protein
MKRQVISLKRFIVRKYIYAKSAQEAIKKEKTEPVDDVWVDEQWKQLQDDVMKNQIGFQQ